MPIPRAPAPYIPPLTPTPKPGMATLYGMVKTERGNPLQCIIDVRGLSKWRRITADKWGRYSGDVRPERYTLVYSMNGYIDFTTFQYLSEGLNELNITLRERPTPVIPVGPGAIPVIPVYPTPPAIQP